MEIVIETTNAEQTLYDLAEILTKLRYNTKMWEERYGSQNRFRKRHWEAKADRWILEHVKLKNTI